MLHYFDSILLPKLTRCFRKFSGVRPERDRGFIKSYSKSKIMKNAKSTFRRIMNQNNPSWIAYGICLAYGLNPDTWL